MRPHAPPGAAKAILAAPDAWEARAVPVALLLLLALFLQGLAFIGESSQTSDEAAHLAAGYSYLRTADFRLNREHPPLLKEIAAAPLFALDLDFPWGPLWERAEEWNIGRIFVHENRVPNDRILFLARLPMLLLSLALGWAMFAWGRRLFGPRGALLGLALYALDPNVVAHSCLVTTDLGVTLFMFLGLFALWCWLERPSPRTLLLAGLAIGCAFASKFTALWLLPILGTLAVALHFAGTPLPLRPWSARSPAAGAGSPLLPRLAALAVAAAILAAATIGVLALSYAGRGLPTYLQGLQIGLRHSGEGHTAYLRGTISENGWWYYFLYAYLVKTPIGTLLLVGLTIAAVLAGKRLSARSECFLWIPVLVTIAITSFWKVNIGLRHLLPIYPFLYLAAGRLAAPARRRQAGLALSLLLGSSLLWNVWEAIRITPYQLAYFNQLVGGPANGHLHLLDSNLDWGQSSKALRRYMISEGVPAIDCAYGGNSDPWYYGVSYQYVPGSGNLDAAKRRPIRMPDSAPRELLAVSPMVAHSVLFNTHDLYDWVLTLKPIARPGLTYLVYDITGDAPSHANLARLYLSFSLLELADFEARRTLRIDPENELARAVLEKLREVSGEGGAPAASGRPDEVAPGG
jgi:dolichyl-phosphate-mannose-protein mannosyltransferase